MVVVISVIIAIAVGAGLFLWSRNSSTDLRVNGKEFALGVAAAVLVTFAISSLGTKIAINNMVGGYKEFWNGSIVSSGSSSTFCQRDGNCQQTYSCDPYTVLVTYTYTVNGKTQTGVRPETRYHECPYVTREYSYWLNDSFGDRHMLMDHGFAANPERWRGGKGVPGDVPRGIPEAWTRAVKDIRAGDPPPATKINKYDNYILASKRTILKKYSEDIVKYKKQGLMPPHTRNLKSPLRYGFEADKVVFVKTNPPNQDEWQKSLSHLNSVLGSERQGDMHMVVLPARLVNDPSNYVRALVAHWQGKGIGKWAIGKNAVAVVVGLSDDNKTVKWVKADTGMPIGNGGLKSSLSHVKEIPAEPRSLIGYPIAKWNGKKLSFTHSGGIIETVVLETFPFIRGCMDCKDKNDSGTSYVYLKKELQVSTGAKFLFALLATFLNLGIWALMYNMPFFEPLTSTSRPRRGSYY